MNWTTAARELATVHLGRPADSVEPVLHRGIVNHVYTARTGRTAIILRMTANVRGYQEYLKERLCIEQAAAKGVAVPTVLAVGQWQTIAYMVQSLVPGENGQDAPAQKTWIWRRLGEFARLIHSIEVHGYGENLLDPSTGAFQAPIHDNFDGSWPGFLQYNSDSLTEDDQLLTRGVITREQSTQIKGLLAELMAHRFEFGLVHGDLSLKNTIVDPDGRISLLDWGSAEVNVVPHREIAQLQRAHAEDGSPDANELQAFLAGYGLTEAGMRRMQPELDALRLVWALDTCRWALDCAPDRVGQYAAYTKKVLAHLAPNRDEGASGR